MICWKHKRIGEKSNAHLNGIQPPIGGFTYMYPRGQKEIRVAMSRGSSALVEYDYFHGMFVRACPNNNY